MADLKLKKVDSLPSTLAENATIIYDGEIWIGNSDDEPFPAKGYKEYSAIISLRTDNGSVTVNSTTKNDFNITPSVNVSTGVYTFVFSGITATDFNFAVIDCPSIIQSNGASTIYSVGKIDSSAISNASGSDLSLGFALRNTSFTKANIDVSTSMEVSFKVYA